MATSLPDEKWISATALAAGGLNDDVGEIARIAEVATRWRHKALLPLGQTAVKDRQRTGDVTRTDHVS